jgi:hypothetical protein
MRANNTILPAALISLQAAALLYDRRYNFAQPMRGKLADVKISL